MTLAALAVDPDLQDFRYSHFAEFRDEVPQRRGR
jgi:hypothetical protein